jgi:hypothetical protein
MGQGPAYLVASRFCGHRSTLGISAYGPSERTKRAATSMERVSSSIERVSREPVSRSREPVSPSRPSERVSIAGAGDETGIAASLSLSRCSRTLHVVPHRFGMGPLAPGWNHSRHWVHWTRARMADAIENSFQCQIELRERVSASRQPRTSKRVRRPGGETRSLEAATRFTAAAPKRVSSPDRAFVRTANKQLLFAVRWAGFG